MTNLKIGSVSHYYSKIGVAVIDLTSSLSVGDVIYFKREGEDMFEQEVKSMQVEHEKISEAKSGDTVGLKVDEEVKPGAEIYKKQ